jgi:hypothetical protein
MAQAQLWIFEYGEDFVANSRIVNGILRKLRKIVRRGKLPEFESFLITLIDITECVLLISVICEDGYMNVLNQQLDDIFIGELRQILEGPRIKSKSTVSPSCERRYSFSLFNHRTRFSISEIFSPYNGICLVRKPKEMQYHTIVRFQNSFLIIS